MLRLLITQARCIEKITQIIVTSSGVCIISFASVAGSLVRIASAGFTLIFSLTRGIIKKLLSITRNKKKRHDKILMLAKSRFLSQTLVDMEISHEEFNAIIRENQKYERMKENVRNVSKRSSAENIRKYESEQC